MMVTIYTSDGGVLEIEDFDKASALDMVEGLSTQEFATFEMGEATVLVNVDHIVRIDLD